MRAAAGHQRRGGFAELHRTAQGRLSCCLSDMHAPPARFIQFGKKTHFDLCKGFQENSKAVIEVL
jgi:hypothetical protein